MGFQKRKQGVVFAAISNSVLFRNLEGQLKRSEKMSLLQV